MSDTRPNTANIQSARMREALERLYDGWAVPEDVLTWALSDLRHFADKHELSFAECDRKAHQTYLEEK